MNNKIVAASLIIAGSSFGTAHALDLAVGTKASTLGAGIEVYAPVSRKFNARIGMNKLGYTFDQEIDGIQYDGDIDLNSLSLNADWHPFGGVFRLTGGLVLNNNELSGTASPDLAESVNIEIGGTNYSSDDIKASAKIGFEKIAPYFGIGFDRVSKTKGGFGFSAEVGVLLQGSPEVGFTADFINTPSDALNAQLNSDIETEIGQIEDEMSDFDIFPVASLGLTYQFK